MKKLLALLLPFLALSSLPLSASTPPNFIILFTDDQGYQDLGCYGSPDIATPNLDRMAKEGMRFTSFYAQTICGPSRTALMTASYPLRVGQVGNRYESHPVVHSEEITIAEVLNAKGYKSAAFGKWDLAKHSQSDWITELLPRGQGFDYFFGTPSSNDRVVHLLRNESLVEGNADMATLTERYTDEAIQYIEENKDGPFFVYLAHTMPHTLLEASERFKGKSRAGLYGDVIEEIDHNAGRVLDKVKELGLDDNTYVIFTSDNGPWLLRKDHGGHALPLRSGKTTCWEGGVRVPCIVRAPGRVPAGTTCDLVTATIDLLPTLASLAGAELPGDRVLDGLDISRIWHGEQDELDRPFYYYQHHYLRGVRKGDWKVMLKHEEGAKSATARWANHVDAKDARPLAAHQLYNLRDDIGETTDLAAKHPDKLAELLELAEWARADIGDHDRIGKNARFFDEGPNRLARAADEPKAESKAKGKSRPAAPAAREKNSAHSGTPRKPNFVVIFTDDQGYGDLGCYGGEHVSTPRIDKMAAEGSRLTSFYVAAPVCTPSRAALMTGCYPRRIGMATGSNFAVLLAGDPKGLHPDEITIAEVLKGAGYRTGMFGKWHLGDQPEFLPTRQGFDEFYGIPFSHDIHPFHPRQEHFRFPPLAFLDNETVIEMDPDADYLTKRLTDRAVEFIRRNHDEPFFVYLPHPIPHKPLHVSPPFMEDVAPAIRETLEMEDGNIDYKTRDRMFRQAIAEIDWSVGTILDTLEEVGVDENTLVIFTSDNGPAVGNAGPLRGKKGSTFEGGMREPTVIRWPGKIPAGRNNDELMTAMDLLPTFAKLAGAEMPTDRVIDGKDIWPVLAGEAETPHEAFFYHGGNNLRAVRSGDWKLHVKDGKPVALHDLETDIGEQKNVLPENRPVAKRLLEEIATFEKDLAENSRPAAFVEKPVPLEMAAGETRPPADKPNFVVIFADDLGYGDISAYRSTATRTPNLDALAAEGFRSLDFFVPANVCSPSRAALLTGRYPMRCGMPVARNEGHPKYKQYGFSSEELTIPELLKPAGYRSLMVGKWHLGMEVEGSHPLDAGFDEHLGIPSNYEGKRGKTHKTLFRGRKVEAENVPFQALTKRYTDEAVAFIERQRDEPFFLFFSHHIPHTPHLPSQPFLGSSGRDSYGDVIRELDDSVGRIMTALRDAGIDDNTLVVFTSDNGPGRAGSAGGLRGGKFVTLEGGHRVPGLFCWPGHIPPGQISGATLTSMDLLPLFCGLAGVDLPGDRTIDGKDIFPILQGKETASPHESLAYYNGTNLQAVREGRWKLHLPRTVEDQPFWNRKPGGGKVFAILDRAALFDLENDRSETRDVADRHSEIVARLQKRAEAFRAELGDVRAQGSDQRAIRLEDPQIR